MSILRKIKLYFLHRKMLKVGRKMTEGTTMSDKPWYQSKTKWGAIILGLSVAFGGVALLLTGTGAPEGSPYEGMSATQLIITGASIVLGALGVGIGGIGIRDVLGAIVKKITG